MIRVNDLDYSYSQQDHALKGISFEVKDQEWLSILGHNGSGKSTISKLLVGILAPQKGSIYYDDIELTEKTVDKIRNHVGIVFQNPDNQFVGVNVKYDIAFGLENRCVPRSEMQKLIVEYATKVGMQDYLLREPQTLSGGQKQRVAIAGILALNTDVIILDEATSMLDNETEEKIISILLDSFKDTTIILIAHRLSTVKNANTIYVLNNGTIMEHGNHDQLLEQKGIYYHLYNI